jgi:hypothetical protein
MDRQVALPPGVYTIQTLRPDGPAPAPPVLRAITNPEEKGKPLTLRLPGIPFDPNQRVREQSTTLYDIPHSPVISQFIVTGSGLIIAGFDRNSLAYSHTPSLAREPVIRSTTGVPWLINVAA